MALESHTMNLGLFVAFFKYTPSQSILTGLAMKFHSCITTQYMVDHGQCSTIVKWKYLDMAKKTFCTDPPHFTN